MVGSGVKLSIWSDLAAEGPRARLRVLQDEVETESLRVLAVGDGPRRQSELETGGGDELCNVSGS